MTTPATHHLTVTDQHGKQVRGRVVYLQPKAERWREDSANVHIVTREWLEVDRHSAIYHTPTTSYAGEFLPVAAPVGDSSHPGEEMNAEQIQRKLS